MKNNPDMRNKILSIMLLIPLLFTCVEAFSQSIECFQEKVVIIMKDGKQVEDAQLWQLHSNILEYELNGNLHDALIADVEKIHTPDADYFFNANDSLEKASAEISGTTDSITTEERAAIRIPAKVKMKGQYVQGYRDAEKYYNGTGAAIGGFVSGMVPGLGWMVTLPIIGATKPQMYNSDNPNVMKLQDKDYYAGYKKKATNKKLGNVFGGFSAGLTILLLLLL